MKSNPLFCLMRNCRLTGCSRFLPDQDIPPQCGTLRRDLCQHSQEGLEARPGHQAHPPHHQVSSDSPKPGECSQRRGRQTVTR